MKLSAIDLGGRPAHLATGGGQAVTATPVPGGRAISWSQGGAVDKLDIDFSIEAWQALGGQSANSIGALRLLEAQLEELLGNPDMQPVYLEPFQTDASSPSYPARSDPHDGWYWFEALSWDQESYNQRGAVDARATFTKVAEPFDTLGFRWVGGGLNSTYTSVPVPLIAYPVGATQQPATQLSRVGGEGTIPLSVLASGSTVNPLYFARPGTVAALFTGGVKVYDTVTAGGNAVPSAGSGFANANWVQVYGTQHDFTGDAVVTNGLLLLRMNQGGTGAPDVYLWNTNGTAGWQQVASLQYKDSPSFNVGNIRGIDLLSVGYQAASVWLTLGTSAGNYARFRISLDAGQYGATVVPDLRTQANSVAYGLDLILTTSIKIVANEGGVADIVTQGTTNLAPTAGAGWSVAISSTANQPLVGLWWATPPNNAQPAGGSTTDIGFGETTGPAQGSLRTYGIWAVPFTGTPANFMAEAESGTLNTGWSSTADAGSSGGNAAKCASGTAATNADLWGTAWVPPAGKYDVWVRLRVASTASSTSQMQVGLWNSTDATFVASSTYAPNTAGLSTSYVWVRVAQAITPTATKSMRFRATTTATTTTDWFFDQAALVPVQSATLGQGDFPADIWAQVMFAKSTRLVRG